MFAETRFRSAALVFLVAVGACSDAAPEADSGAPSTSVAEALIERSIAYHDPDGKWDTASIELEIAESRPEAETRTTAIRMAPGSGAMVVRRQTGDGEVAFEMTGETIRSRSVDGDDAMEEEALAERGLDAERVRFLRNYYLFLWGLPMKLRDPGTIVAPEPEAATFDGQEALAVRVTYDPEVGGDTWYFYIDPESARLIGYRFYHDEAANDGEYIHLSGEIEHGGLRLPARRAWFMHQDDEFLGEDEAVSLVVTDAP